MGLGGHWAPARPRGEKEGLQKGGTRLSLTSPGCSLDSVPWEAKAGGLSMGGDLEETSRAQPVRAGPGHLEDGTQSGAELLLEPRLLNTPLNRDSLGRAQNCADGARPTSCGANSAAHQLWCHPPGLLYLVSGRLHGAGEERQQSETKSSVLPAGPGGPHTESSPWGNPGVHAGVRPGEGSRTHGQAADQAPCCPPRPAWGAGAQRHWELGRDAKLVEWCHRAQPRAPLQASAMGSGVSCLAERPTGPSPELQPLVDCQPAP